MLSSIFGSLVIKNPTALAVGVSVGYHRKDVSFDTEYPIDTTSPRHDYP